MLYTQEDLVFSAALAVYIGISIMTSVVRWGHRCEPFARHMDFYHPAWRTVVFCFLTNILMIPVLFMPQEADAVLALRVMLMLSSPYFCAMLLFTHFGRMVNLGHWKVSLYMLSLPFVLLVGAALWVALKPGTQLEGAWARQLGALSGTMALLFFLSFIMALVLIGRARKRFSEKNFSSKEDFPKSIVLQAAILSAFHVFVSWSMSFSGNKCFLAIGFLILSALNIVFLLVSMQPHRTFDVRRMEEESRVKELVEEEVANNWEDPVEEIDAQSLSDTRKEELIRIIRHAVEEEMAYLDSHLTLISLSRICGINRSYLSAVLSENMGGFFNYVNRCRLDYAAKYKAENPAASVEDIATASGFGSRQSFYNARKQLEK